MSAVKERITIAGITTTDGVNFGLLWPGDVDYRFTSLIINSIIEMKLKKRVVSFTALDSAVGIWMPHNDPAPGETVPRYRLCDYERQARQALARFGYQVIK